MHTTYQTSGQKSALVQVLAAGAKLNFPEVQLAAAFFIERQSEMTPVSTMSHEVSALFNSIPSSPQQPLVIPPPQQKPSAPIPKAVSEKNGWVTVAAAKAKPKPKTKVVAKTTVTLANIQSQQEDGDVDDVEYPEKPLVYDKDNYPERIKVPCTHDECWYDVYDHRDPVVQHGTEMIIQHQLFIRGLPREEDVHELIRELRAALNKQCQPDRVYIEDGHGTAFLTFKNHKKAAAAYKIYVEEAQTPNLEEMAVNFVHKKK